MKGPEDALCDRLTFIECKRELPPVDCVKACAHHCLTRGYLLQEGVRMSGKKGRLPRSRQDRAHVQLQGRKWEVPSTRATRTSGPVNQHNGVRRAAPRNGGRADRSVPSRWNAGGDARCCEGQAGGQWSVSPPDASSHALPHELFVYYDICVGGVGINVSARRHGVVGDDIRHAITHAVLSDEIDPEPPVRRLHLGPDRSGSMLEVVTLHFDDGVVLARHGC